MSKKILLTGIQPSGKPHIGNYFGMMKQVVDMQDEYESFPFIANYHSLNTIQNAETMRENIINVVLDYLAIGLDPEKVTLFKQSDVPQVTELCWILDTIITMPYLMRAHAFKDAEAKNKDISIGTFNYPILMAADILIQNTDVVPVGKDQQQHVEMARDIAEKFNRIYGETFKLPEAIIKEEVAVVPGTDGRKMSKSYGNIISLFASEEETEKLVMSIPMDSKGIEEKKNPEDYNLYKIFKLFATGEENEKVKEMFEKGGVGYAEIKKYVADVINNYLREIRERRKELEKNPEEALRILKEGGEKMRKIAEEKMKEVRKKVGIS
ncbi:tryptophan--tRNA ligase [Candidatus Campbellbacteria bacterium RIFOXYC2_FULL_35_25]|uniref:Tryptophan--tRNA ligase n=1 Tax=Candidatus Campbellbacteria bacterium RIFOXYC2_FULL_35_25 TaxID=1797582 RepID=A0A1F5EJA2_9BACT|nr:MAG: tryptophan--tRNA ligase [Candidatus Campbellbacteria bacterium RIFOXYC2_FULL_35_25]